MFTCCSDKILGMFFASIGIKIAANRIDEGGAAEDDDGLGGEIEHRWLREGLGTRAVRNRTLRANGAVTLGSRQPAAAQLEGEATGNTLLALDAVDAGVGDTVLIVQEGWSASTVATGKAGAAIDSAIVGVVDHIDLLEAP